jgi:hypothetical protein
VHWDAEGGSRTALVYIRLERSCATLTWSRPGWSGLRTGTGGSGSFPDYRCLRRLLPNSAEGFSYIHTVLTFSGSYHYLIFNLIYYCCCYHHRHIIGNSSECGLVIAILNLTETVRSDWSE